MNNSMVQGFYNSVKQIIQQSEQPNINDNYTCFCGAIVQIDPFDNVYNHLCECKKYKEESSFYKDFAKLNLNFLKLPHLLALKAEFLLMITQIDEFLRKKNVMPKTVNVVRKASQHQNRGNFYEKYAQKHEKIFQLQKQPSQKTQVCQSCGNPGDSNLEIDYLHNLQQCGHVFCLGCLRKQINSQFLSNSGKILCSICQLEMPLSDIEQFIGKERLHYLKTKLRTGESPIQSTIPCNYCYRYIKQKQQKQGKRDICENQLCLEKDQLACQRILKCKHFCNGYRDEKKCLPCLQCELKIADQYCSICYTETFKEAPCIQSNCGHVFHFRCIVERLQRKWSTFYISFGFCLCPLCKKWLEFPKDSLPQKMLAELNELNAKVRRQASLRVGLFDDSQILNVEDAINVLAFYQCSRCQKPYFGGKKDCQLDLEQQENQLNPLELICPGCCGIKFEGCPKHGTEFLEYKCRFCCNIATYFCWGTTHFCQQCHLKQSQGQYVTSIKIEDLPKCPGKPNCPIGGNHLPNGQEQCLGCGLCKNQ